MIADALKSEIDRYAAEMVHRNAMFVGAAQGRLSPEKAGFYLFNLRHVLEMSPVHLERARVRALALGDDRLAEHYATKRAEELGHHRWAESDLRSLYEELGIARVGACSPALLGLLRHLEETIDRDPALYLAHVLFSEYLVTLMGPAWLALIEERCAIPARMFSAVSRHADLDKEHAADGLDAIDRLVPDPAQLGPMRALLRRVIVDFDRFSAEVMAFGDRSAVCETSSAA